MSKFLLVRLKKSHILSELNRLIIMRVTETHLEVNLVANQQHLDLLKQNVHVWNQWRQDHPEILPDLSGSDLAWSRLSNADLSEADLSGVNFTWADLYRVNLIGANLSHANLSGADLSGTHLYRANLYGANLTETLLYRADLRGADLSETNLQKAFLEETIVD